LRPTEHSPVSGPRSTLGYRNRGPCGIPETCHAPGVLNPHPNAAYGYALLGIGLLAMVVSVVAPARRTAG